MRVLCAGCQLRQMSLFRPFSDQELAFVSSVKRAHISQPANRDIVRAGEVGGHLYTLYEGWAFRYKRLSDGSRQILTFLLPGDLIGLQSTLFGQIDHSVQTLTPASLCVLNGRPIDEIYDTLPDFALSLTRYLADEERRLDIRLTMVGRRNASQRLAYLLLDIFDRLKERGSATGDSCPFPIRRQHMADALGLTGAHVNRTLNALRGQGLATVESNTLAIHDRQGLVALAGYAEAGARQRMLF